MSRFLLVFGAAAAICAAQQQQLVPPDSLAPFLPTPQEVVERMLRAADVKPGEMVYDLGSGDGRVIITAARDFGAKAVGIEIKERLVLESRKQVEELGLAEQVKVIHGDALKADLSPADVVTLFLLTSSNEILRPNFEKDLKPGARVVSYSFEVRGWKPAKVERVTLENRSHTIFVYKRSDQGPSAVASKVKPLSFRKKR